MIPHNPTTIRDVEPTAEHLFIRTWRIRDCDDRLTIYVDETHAIWMFAGVEVPAFRAAC